MDTRAPCSLIQYCSSSCVAGSSCSWGEWVLNPFLCCDFISLGVNNAPRASLVGTKIFIVVALHCFSSLI